MEATVGIEPTNEGFADPCLTTWLRRLKAWRPEFSTATTRGRIETGPNAKELETLERETGFEPATPTLARLCSTTELFPLVELQRLLLVAGRVKVGSTCPAAQLASKALRIQL